MGTCFGPSRMSSVAWSNSSTHDPLFILTSSAPRVTEEITRVKQTLRETPYIKNGYDICACFELTRLILIFGLNRSKKESSQDFLKCIRLLYTFYSMF